MGVASEGEPQTLQSKAGGRGRGEEEVGMEEDGEEGTGHICGARGSIQ